MKNELIIEPYNTLDNTLGYAYQIRFYKEFIPIFFKARRTTNWWNKEQHEDTIDKCNEGDYWLFSAAEVEIIKKELHNQQFQEKFSDIINE